MAEGLKKGLGDESSIDMRGDKGIPKNMPGRPSLKKGDMKAAPVDQDRSCIEKSKRDSADGKPFID